MRILIVDDHPIVRAGLRRLLAEEPGAEIGEAADAETALRHFRTHRPDLVVLDLNLPGLGGLEAIPRLRAADPGVPVLVLSMRDDPIHASRAIEAGAAGYVSKGAPPEEVLTAIRRVANGQTYIEREIAERLVFAHARPALPAHPLSRLSRRELEILRLLGTGHSLSEIADTVGVSYKTAANRCSQIKAKLGVAGTADLIRIAIRSGVADGGGKPEAAYRRSPPGAVDTDRPRS